MKKIILAAIAVLGFSFANAQEGKFKVGAHAGLPIGGSDFYSVNIGVDASYMWKVADKFTLGAITGYSTYLGKTNTVNFMGVSVSYKSNNASFIPIAATGQYSLSDKFFVGADLGYAISVGEGTGGFLYQPKFGYQNEKIELYMGYKDISYTTTTDHGFSKANGISSLNLGFKYKF